MAILCPSPPILLALNSFESCSCASCILEWSHTHRAWGVVSCLRSILYDSTRDLQSMQNLSIEKPPLDFVWEKMGILAFGGKSPSHDLINILASLYPYSFHHYILIATCYLTPWNLKQIFLFIYPHQLNISLFGSTQPSIKIQLKDYPLFGILKAVWQNTLNGHHPHTMSMSTNHESGKWSQESTMWARNLSMVLFASLILSSWSCFFSTKQGSLASQDIWVNTSLEIYFLLICHDINDYGPSSQLRTVTHLNFHGWKFSGYHIRKLYVFIPEAEDMVLPLFEVCFFRIPLFHFFYFSVVNFCINIVFDIVLVIILQFFT